MKNIYLYTIVTIIAVVGVGALFSFGAFDGPCDRPLSYRIGELDSRFNISTSTLRDLLLQAEDIWEESADRELFMYDPEADFTINFIFDERQSRTDQVGEYERTLANLEASHDEVIASYEAAKQEYDSSLRQYESQRDRYEADLEEYNQTVNEWNERGGAPEDVREQLAEDRAALEADMSRLQSFQNDLEVLRSQVNRLADRGNMVAEEYNETAVTFGDRYGGSHQFNQATYLGNSINVYQFETEADLLLALAHEFGHALGIEHVSSSDSVMYYLMEDQSLHDISLTEEDRTALNKICGND